MNLLGTKKRFFKIRDVGNLRFRGFVVKNWNVPFTVEDFHGSKQSVMRWF